MNSTILKNSLWVIGGAVFFGASDWAAGAPPADSGWYVEGGIATVDVKSQVAGFTTDDDETGWTLGGGYRFNPYLALSGAYHDLGNNRAATDCPPPVLCLIESSDKIDLTGLSLSAIGSWPVSNSFELFAKLGVMRWDANFSRFSNDKNGTDLLYGAGIGVSPAPAWRVRLQYEAFDLDADSLSLTLGYSF